VGSHQIGNLGVSIVKFILPLAGFWFIGVLYRHQILNGQANKRFSSQINIHSHFHVLFGPVTDVLIRDFSNYYPVKHMGLHFGHFSHHGCYHSTGLPDVQATLHNV
jgi:hypothetical protein